MRCLRIEESLSPAIFTTLLGIGVLGFVEEWCLVLKNLGIYN